jgi:hypothetical protein
MFDAAIPAAATATVTTTTSTTTTEALNAASTCDSVRGELLHIRPGGEAGAAAALDALEEFNGVQGALTMGRLGFACWLWCATSL